MTKSDALIVAKIMMESEDSVERCYMQRILVQSFPKLQWRPILETCWDPSQERDIIEFILTGKHLVKKKETT